VYLGCVVVLFGWAIIENCFPGILSRTGYSYYNPILILGAAVLLLLFLNINIGTNKVINILAKGVFSVFLLHGYLIGHIGIDRYVKENTFIMIGHIFVSTIIIFLICTICHYIYEAISTPVYNMIFKNRDIVIVDLEKV